MSDAQSFIPPYAPPLTGQEGFWRATWKFMRNPIEGFGPLAYSQDIVTASAIGSKLHIITSPEGMHQVLSVQADKFPKAPIDSRIFSTATKQGLLSVHGDQWRKQRRVVAPMFRPALLEEFSSTIIEAIAEFTHNLGEGGRLDLQTAMSDLTFNVLAKALLGDAEGLSRDQLHRDMQAGIEAVGNIRPDDLLPLPRNFPRPISPSGYRAIKRVRKAADILLAQHRLKPKDDLVGLLTSAVDPHSGAPLSLSEQRDNLTGFFIAGHETTALTLAWALYLLGRVPDAQARLYEEVSSQFPAGAIPYEAVKRLPFCRAVIDETQRLFPPAALMSRQCAQDTQILGRQVSKGDLMTLAIYVMHRREAYWEAPNEFRPQRFMDKPELHAKMAPFMPFGGGPRICVAAGFAMMEAMMALAQIVRDYHIQVADDVYPRPKLTVTLRPEGGIAATLRRRE